MPALDKPIEDLLLYKGSSPCPEDIDEYWDSALKEMKALDKKIEYKKAGFQVPNFECYDLYYNGVKDARIHARFVKPANIDGKIPAIVRFHGYSASASGWIDLISFASCGFCVADMDCRGQGGESEDKGGVKGNTLNGHIIRGLDDEPNNLLFRHIFLDAAELAEIIMDMPYVDENRVMAYGGSQGGGLTIACAALEPRIHKAVAFYPFLSDYKRVWDMDMVNRAYSEIKNYFRHFDPNHKREKDVFERLGYIDVQNLAKRIKAKFLMFTGLMDDCCPPSTQFAAYNKITTEKKAIFFHDYGHEGLPGSNETAMQFFLGKELEEI